MLTGAGQQRQDGILSPLKRSFSHRVQWLGINCQIKRVGWKLLLALNLRYPNI